MFRGLKSLWYRYTHCVIKNCYLERDFRGHHVKHRGSGGSEGPWNKIGFCRVHHNEYHIIGREAFLRIHPEAKPLIERAERLEEIYQRWKRGLITEPQLQLESVEVHRFAMAEKLKQSSLE
jgi:hypothetical protein